MILIGPCMLLAPLVAVLVVIALPLWPVAIAVLGVLWLVVWPLERATTLVGLRVMRGWSRAVGRTFYFVLKPWVYLDTRYPDAPQQPDSSQPRCES